MSQYDSIEQKASYGIGRNMGDQLAQQAFAGLDIPALQQGLADALNGLEFAVSRDDINDAFQVITARMQEEQEAVAKAAAADGEAFLADNAKRAEVKTTESGLQYEVLVEGNGAVPVAGQSVRVHYHGTFTHGGVFDSSVARGQPAEFPVTGVIAGWVWDHLGDRLTFALGSLYSLIGLLLVAGWIRERPVSENPVSCVKGAGERV